MIVTWGCEQERGALLCRSLLKVSLTEKTCFIIPKAISFLMQRTATFQKVIGIAVLIFVFPLSLFHLCLESFEAQGLIQLICYLTFNQNNKDSVPNQHSSNINYPSK